MSTERHLQPNDFLIVVKVKGYSIEQLAERWEMTTRHLYRKAKEPTQRDWDSVAGLPPKGNLTRG